MLEIPEKLFNREFEKVEIGISTLNFFPKDNLEKEQIGYGYDQNNVNASNRLSKEFVVIGKNLSFGDPIIAKVDETEIPVFTMFKDDKTTNNIEKIANSFEQYMGVLSMIKETDLYRKDKIIELLDEIEEIVPQNSLYYWEDLINSAYNYLTD